MGTDDVFQGYLKVEYGVEWVYILRETLDEEVTLDDGSVVRIEAGREIFGTYYSADNTPIGFDYVLGSGALNNLVAATGLALASFSALMAF